jgi:hypothetical protein
MSRKIIGATVGTPMNPQKVVEKTNLVKLVSKLSEDKVDKPSVAKVGQIIVVKTVDKNGKPTEFEAVDINVNNTSISLKDVTTNKNYKLEVINGKLTMTEVE